MGNRADCGEGGTVAVQDRLLKRGLVTDAGSGIPRMIRLLRERIGREPGLRTEGNEFVVALPRSDPRPPADSVGGGLESAASLDRPPAERRLRRPHLARGIEARPRLASLPGLG